MSDSIYTVLYTHQKTKKAKTWQDGTLKLLSTGTKAVLYDDKGAKLDVLHVRAQDVVSGEQLESDRFYIQIEELRQKSSLQPVTVATTCTVSSQVSSNFSQSLAPIAKTANSQSTSECSLTRLRAGLKRKRNGFIPPRLVRPCVEETAAVPESSASSTEPFPGSANPFNRFSALDERRQHAAVVEHRFPSFLNKEGFNNDNHEQSSLGKRLSDAPQLQCSKDSAGVPSLMAGGRRPPSFGSPECQGNVHLKQAPFARSLNAEQHFPHSAGSMENIAGVQGNASLLPAFSEAKALGPGSVLKSSPWRTFGLSRYASSVPSKSPSQEDQAMKSAQEQKVKDAGTNIELSSFQIPSPLSSSEDVSAHQRFFGGQKPTRLGESDQVVKRSASEIMALLGRKTNHFDKSKDSVSTISSAGGRKSDKTNGHVSRFQEVHKVGSLTFTSEKREYGMDNPEVNGKSFTVSLGTASPENSVSLDQVLGSPSNLSSDHFHKADAGREVANKSTPYHPPSAMGACHSRMSLSQILSPKTIHTGEETDEIKLSKDVQKPQSSPASCVDFPANTPSRNWKTAISSRLSISTPSLSKQDFEEDEECGSSENPSVYVQDRYSQNLSDCDYPSSSIDNKLSGNDGPCITPDVSVSLNHNAVSAVVEDHVELQKEKGNDFDMEKSRCMEDELPSEYTSQGEVTASVEYPEKTSVSKDMPEIKTQNKGEPEVCPSKDADKDLGGCFEISFSPLSHADDSEEEDGVPNLAETDCLDVSPDHSEKDNKAQNILPETGISATGGTVTSGSDFDETHHSRGSKITDESSKYCLSKIESDDMLKVDEPSETIKGSQISDNVYFMERSHNRDIELDKVSCTKENELIASDLEDRDQDGELRSTRIQVSWKEEFEIPPSAEQLSEKQLIQAHQVESFLKNPQNTDGQSAKTFGGDMKTLADLAISPDSVECQGSSQSFVSLSGTASSSNRLKQGGSLEEKDKECFELSQKKSDFDQKTKEVQPNRESSVGEMGDEIHTSSQMSTSNDFPGYRSVNYTTTESSQFSPHDRYMYRNAQNQNSYSPSSFKRSAVVPHYEFGHDSPRPVLHVLQGFEKNYLPFPENSNIDTSQSPLNENTRLSTSLPVHQHFHTVSDVLSNKGREACWSASSSSGIEDGEDPILSLQLRKGNEKACKQNSGDDYQFVLTSGLPHPDCLTTGFKQGTPYADQALGQTENITRAISAKMTDYKMQGMVASAPVERPMAWKQEGAPDAQRSLLTQGQITNPVSLKMDWSGSLDRQGTKPSHFPDPMWTPEARLRSPAGEAMEGSDDSFFVDWADGKPRLLRNNPVVESTPDFSQQVPLFSDALSLPKNSQIPVQPHQENLLLHSKPSSHNAFSQQPFFTRGIQSNMNPRFKMPCMNNESQSEDNSLPSIFLNMEQLRYVREATQRRENVCEMIVDRSPEQKHLQSFGDCVTNRKKVVDVIPENREYMTCMPGNHPGDSQELQPYEKCNRIYTKTFEENIWSHQPCEIIEISPETLEEKVLSSQHTDVLEISSETFEKENFCQIIRKSHKNDEGNVQSPQVFSQISDFIVPKCSPKLVQRQRKLKPVLSAPDETLKTQDESHISKQNAQNDVIRNKEYPSTGRSLPCRKPVAETSEKLFECLAECRQSPAESSKKLSLCSTSQTVDRVTCDQKKTSDTITMLSVKKRLGDTKSDTDVFENMDFTGFEDSFPESDFSDEQLLTAEKLAKLSGNVTSKQKESHVSMTDSDSDLRDETNMFLSNSSSRIATRNKASIQDSSNLSVLDHSDFVVSNSSLDFMDEDWEVGMVENIPQENQEADNSTKESISQDKREVEGGAPCMERALSSDMKSTHLKTKAERFAERLLVSHQFQSLGKEKLVKGQINKCTDYFACKSPTLQTFDQTRKKSFLLSEQKNTTESDCLLVPKACTDSPPLDFSPEKSQDEISQIRTTCTEVRDSKKVLTRTQLSPYNFQSCVQSSISTPSLKQPGSHKDEAQKDSKPELFSGKECPSRLDGNQTMERSPLKQTGVGELRNTRAFIIPRKVGLRKFQKPGLATLDSCLPEAQFQNSLCQDLQFCSQEEIESQVSPLRQMVIPAAFDTVSAYRQVLTAALTEYLNLQLFDVARKYHATLSKVDVSSWTEGVGDVGSHSAGSSNPPCKCGISSKVVQVKKEGPNKGRFFYACSGPRETQCKFFQWLDQSGQLSTSKAAKSSPSVRPKFSDSESIVRYFRGQHLSLHCQCHFLRRSDDKGFPAWARPRRTDSVQKKSLYIKLSKKDYATTHAKDDLWVVSKTLSFSRRETFVARSTFHGPNSNSEVAIEPVAGYFVSLWNDGCVCHAIHCGNASTELTCLSNLKDHVDMASLPLLPYLLGKPSSTDSLSGASSKGFKVPQVSQSAGKQNLQVSAQFLHDLASEFIIKHQLNKDQASALQRAADMMSKDTDNPASVLLIHGVFGAGKSFLLSVLILFLVEVFQRNATYSPGVPFPWKLLLSSTTNVAVDRVLQGLLDLGFDDFVRVGSVKKIAKPVLPYSMHATGSATQELKDLQEMLKCPDITPSEKHCVRKSIEKHKLGENRKRLGAVRVVGVTCAASSFQCLDKMQFPFVVLDECSQMTEPASLLPIARFTCEKLVLVGDPKQLDPTLQGSDAAHREGLEQTLFDRLIRMGHSPVMLRTQYRCHPTISAVANSLFYDHLLKDGVTADDRSPILELFPSMCFYDAPNGQEQMDASGSIVNESEAQFVVLLLSVLMARDVQASSVGVITLYRAQARRIVDIIRSTKGDSQQEMLGVQVSTVDAFQGGERDIIILSCVRTHSLGFIDNDKRMNVALTRARHHLLIVGHQRNLYENQRWSQVISHCQGLERGLVSASAASRQFQAVLKQSVDGSTDVSSQHKDMGLERGLVSASAASRQFQAVLKQSVDGSTDVSSQHKDMDEQSESLQKRPSPDTKATATRKRRMNAIKPLITENEEEEEKENCSSDDSLPDGLL